MLLPPDLREWIPEDDMVHFVIEAVAGMNLTTLQINRRGSGRRGRFADDLEQSCHHLCQ